METGKQDDVTESFQVFTWGKKVYITEESIMVTQIRKMSIRI